MIDEHCAHDNVGYEVGATVPKKGAVVSTVHRFPCAGCDVCARVVIDTKFEEES